MDRTENCCLSSQTEAILLLGSDLSCKKTSCVTAWPGPHELPLNCYENTYSHFSFSRTGELTHCQEKWVGAQYQL